MPQGPLSAAHSSSPPPPTPPHSKECPPSPGPSPGPSSHTDRSHHNSSSGRTGRDFPWSPQFYLQSLKPSLCAVHTRLTHARSGCAFLCAHLSPPTALSLTGATHPWPGGQLAQDPTPAPGRPCLLFNRVHSCSARRSPQAPSFTPAHGCPVPALSHSTQTPPPRSCARTPKLHQPAPASSSLISLRHPFRSTLQACKVSALERIRLATFPPKAEALPCVLPALSPRPGVRPTAASVTTAAQQGPGEPHGCFPPLS